MAPSGAVHVAADAEPTSDEGAGSERPAWRFQIDQVPSTLIDNGEVSGTKLVGYFRKYGAVLFDSSKSMKAFQEDVFDLAAQFEGMTTFHGEELLITIRDAGYAIDPVDGGLAIHKEPEIEDLPVEPDPREDPGFVKAPD